MSSFGPTIPGETPVDPTGLKDTSIVNRAMLNAAEARNIAVPFTKYCVGRLTKRMAPFDFNWLLTLHREMFGNVWEWAGAIRQRDVNFGSPFAMISEHLACMLADLNFWTEAKMDMAEQAARLHHRAVQIHPFLNGNGRWSRLLANVWLRRHQNSIVKWPEKRSASRVQFAASIWRRL